MIRRAITFTHRYLGIVIGVVMLMWFASGIVMLYVPYPALSEHFRISALEPIHWQGCCATPSHPLSADQPVDRVQLESAAGVLIARLTVPGESETFVSLDTSGRALTLDATQIGTIAVGTVQRLGLPGAATQPATRETIVRDQWTVSGEYNRDRPLIRFGFDDPQHTHLYISSRSGRVVLWTTARQRFWNWLGAVPHWIYPTVLRSKVKVWAQVVIWAAVLGILLTSLGLYLGVAQFRLRGRRPFSPYAGLWYWHHTMGLLSGVFTLTWVVSGLISMNPWGFLDGSPSPPGPPEHPIIWHDIQASLPSLAASPDASNAVSLVTAPMSGHLFWIVTKEGGAQIRLDATGHSAPVSEQDLREATQHLAAPHGVASATLLQHEDAYYYRHREAIALPVYRAILDDKDHSRLYLDPLSGRLLAGFDGDGQWQRWLFDGLHRLDFSATLRASAAWNALIVLLLIGGIAGSGTGVYLAARRVKLDFTKLTR